MTDPTLQDPWLRLLAHGHPAWMVVSILLALAALRVGMQIRRARFARKPPPRGARALHLRIAKPAVIAILVGAVGGPLSSWWLRGWTPFGTFHGLVGLACAGLFAAALVQGRKLERGELAAREAHARFGALAALAAGLTAIAGFVLLP